ncbi:MAG: hypothetical protein MH137_02580 [Flavobacteriales bacterium]|nr:hypothetical protein [Flavobacteriales bacterium]
MIFSLVNSNAQKISKVEITEIKKGENVGSFALKLYDFPREASTVKPFVNRISSISGVISFNVLSHPAEKPAQAILKVQESDLEHKILKEVLCELNASSYIFRKKTFSDCNALIINKK